VKKITEEELYALGGGETKRATFEWPVRRKQRKSLFGGGGVSEGMLKLVEEGNGKWDVVEGFSEGMSVEGLKEEVDGLYVAEGGRVEIDVQRSKIKAPSKSVMKRILSQIYFLDS